MVPLPWLATDDEVFVPIDAGEVAIVRLPMLGEPDKCRTESTYDPEVLRSMSRGLADLVPQLGLIRREFGQFVRIQSERLMLRDKLLTQRQS